MQEPNTLERTHGGTEQDGPPSKRRRLSGTLDGTNDAEETQHSIAQSPSTSGPVMQNSPFSDEDQLNKEIKSGITEYVNPTAPGFSGVLKQRYTDFLVNEVLPNGQVLHLENLAPPKRTRQQEEKPVEAEKGPADPVIATDKNRNEGGARLDAGHTREENDGNGIEQDSGGVEAVISDDNKASLDLIFGANTARSILSLYEAVLKHPDRKRKDFRSVTSDKITDKEIRTKAHLAVRKVFSSKLETTTADNETISISAAGPAAKPRGGNVAYNAPRGRNKMGWQELGGEYLHFTLYKENKDTMEAVYFLASQLKVGIKNFQFGGTKDRRGVTVQRCSAHRVYAEQMAAVGRNLRASRVGDFQYCPDGLELGDLGGNEFVITLRDAHFPGEDGLDLEQRVELAKKVVHESLESFRRGGFLNYFGLQRFGSFMTSTDTVGVKLLQSDYKGAVDDILTFSPHTLAAAQADPPNNKPFSRPSPQLSTTASRTTAPLISSDDRARALAIHTWQTTQDSFAALALLPRKFSAESNIIRHLGQRHRNTRGLDSLNDYQGALQTIPRNLRLMYVHAYQSLVWNVVAGARWAKHGASVVEGDLVLVKPEVPEPSSNGAQENAQGYKEAVDEAGEALILPTPTASAHNSSSSTTTDIYQRARPLTATEAASGDFTIFDLVLPLPGYDVVYPPNAIGAEYASFMASPRGGGIDPHGMRRGWKDLSLSGGYRKLLGRAEAVSGDVRLYHGEEQLVETDLERLEKKGKGKGGEDGQKGKDSAAKGNGAVANEEARIAVVLRMRLAPSQYATMALRELMKEGGVRTYKPDYGGSR